MALGYGGHVYHAAGALEVSNCVFEKGIAKDNGGSQGNGGAIHSAGTLHVNKSSFIENSAQAAGAIYAVQSTECKISETSIIGNTSSSYPGGGIYAGLRCDLSLSDCEIYGNKGFQSGDDLYYRGGDIEISYTKPLTEIYTTTEKVPYGWMSNYAGQQAEEYDIPIKGRFGNGLQLRFAFADEITVDEPSPEPTPEPTPTPDNDNSPEKPQEPPEDDDDDGEDYTPPKVEKPVQAPSAPNTATSADIPARMLKCGDAVIDTSRSVVLTGYGDGLLHEDDPLTRAQLATIIYRLLSKGTLEKYQTYDSPFADVDSEAWCACYIATLARAGIVNGTGNGEYNPDGVVTWAQVLTVLSRFTEPQEYDLQQIQCDGWAKTAIQTAVALNWIEDGADFNPNASISRGELVELINGVLEKY